MAPIRHHDRCCNPCNIPNHKKVKELRAPSERLCEKWRLTKKDMLCAKCRIICGKEEPDNYRNTSPTNLHPANDTPSGTSSEQIPAASDIFHFNIEDDDECLLTDSTDMELVCEVVEPSHGSGKSNVFRRNKQSAPISQSKNYYDAPRHDYFLIF